MPTYAKTTDVLRSGREHYRLVRLLSYWTYTVRPDCDVPVDIVAVLFGVPQGSVLGPILFLLYVADLLQLVKRHGLHPHCYANNTQIYGFCDLSDVNALQEHLSVCMTKFSPG